MTWSLQPQRGHIPDLPSQRVGPEPDPCLTCRFARPFSCAAEVRDDARVASWVFAGIIGECENFTVTKEASNVHQSE